jgi:type III secretion system FlhB-like substrate exporter
MQTPVVAGRGGRRLRERAEAMGMFCTYDPMLARALAVTPDGQEIPESLYEPVAALVRAL